MHLQIGIISLVYAALILYRKNVLLRKFNIQTWLMIKSGLMFVMLSIAALINQKTFFDKDVIPKLRQNMITIIIFICFTLLEIFGWLYMLKNSDMSRMIPLNSVYISVFSALLGIAILNENFSYKTGAGIIFAIISIYLLN